MPISPDSFIRPDLTLEQVETIRGGSASTFASNSPGGVINFQSRTGKEQGGAVTFAYPEDAKRNLLVQRKR